MPNVNGVQGPGAECNGIVDPDAELFWHVGCFRRDPLFEHLESSDQREDFRQVPNVVTRLGGGHPGPLKPRLGRAPSAPSAARPELSLRAPPTEVFSSWRAAFLAWAMLRGRPFPL